MPVNARSLVSLLVAKVQGCVESRKGQATAGDTSPGLQAIIISALASATSMEEIHIADR